MKAEPSSFKNSKETMHKHIEKTKLDKKLQAVFGPHAYSEGPLATSGTGRRYVGVKLSTPLNSDQVEFLVDSLSHFQILCISGQNFESFSLAHFERFANHWGAPIPHPSNVRRRGENVEWKPFKDRNVSAVNATFPDQLQCLPHTSPTVFVASNMSGPRKEGEPVSVSPGGDWHVDIECERLPIYVSMFLVHKVPESRDAPGGTWIEAPNDIEKFGSLQENPDEELMRLRSQLPLDGGTAYADTEAAFAALPESEQEVLERTRVHRRLNWKDEGWLAPLVRTNPRSGLKSLHSPIWNSRPAIKPPVLVEGMNAGESRAFLDRLEKHVLQPRFRYDHTHTPGDVTIWDNYMILHNSPPIKTNIHSIDDARLLYRISCKGEPALTLPRNDVQEWLDQHINGGYVTPKEIIRVDK